MKSILFTSILLCIFLSSCTRMLYRPEQVHDPMITEKGAVKSTAGVRFSPTDKVPSIDIGVGVSPANRFVVKGALRMRVFGEDFDDSIFTSREFFRGTTVEGGLGYYTEVSDRAFFVIYGSYMYGNNIHFRRTKNSKVMMDSLFSNFSAFSIQPAYVFHRKVITASVGMRFSMYHFNNIYAIGTKVDPALYTSKNGRWYPVWDPYFNLEIGRSAIRGNIQAGFSFVSRDLAMKDLNTGKLFGGGEYNPQTFFKIGLGIAVNLNYLKNKK